MDGGRPGTQTGEDEDPAIAAFSGLQGEVAEVAAAIESKKLFPGIRLLLKVLS